MQSKHCLHKQIEIERTFTHTLSIKLVALIGNLYMLAISLVSNMCLNLIPEIVLHETNNIPFVATSRFIKSHPDIFLDLLCLNNPRLQHFHKLLTDEVIVFLLQRMRAMQQKKPEKAFST